MKLNQSFDTLYALPYYEYLYYLNLLIEETGSKISENIELETGGSTE